MGLKVSIALKARLLINDNVAPELLNVLLSSCVNRFGISSYMSVLCSELVWPKITYYRFKFVKVYKMLNSEKHIQKNSKVKAISLY